MRAKILGTASSQLSIAENVEETGVRLSMAGAAKAVDISAKRAKDCILNAKDMRCEGNGNRCDDLQKVGRRSLELTRCQNRKEQRIKRGAT